MRAFFYRRIQHGMHKFRQMFGTKWKVVTIEQIAIDCCVLQRMFMRVIYINRFELLLVMLVFN